MFQWKQIYTGRQNWDNRPPDLTSKTKSIFYRIWKSCYLDKIYPVIAIFNYLLKNTTSRSLM